MGNYLRAHNLQEALTVLDTDSRIIVAGGTDYYPARVGKPLNDPILDISGLKELRVISDEGDHYRMGALTTWTDIVRTPLPTWFAGLKLAAREVGGVQVQNAGTVCGNLCNASPAADGVPNLLALNALVELSSAHGIRTLPLGEFITGNRQTTRQANEMVTGLLLPNPGASARSTFLKLGARKYLVISIVMVAAVLVPGVDGTVADARIAVGSCSAVAKRLLALETVLRGQPIDPSLAERVKDSHLNPLSPIDDVRGTAAYRRDVALTLVRRAMARLVDENP